MSKQETLLVGKPCLTPEDVGKVAYMKSTVKLSAEARDAMSLSRAAVEATAKRSDRPAYGINTGFGALAEVPISLEDLGRLQLNLVRSHACAIDPCYPIDITRAMLLLRAQVLALGHSGVRPQLVMLILQMLNKGVHPLVPSRGSVGASGDLAPLAHLALVLIGEGEAEFEGEVLPGNEALARAGLQPVVLEAKEGLALINGTQAMTSDGCLALLMAERLCKVADIAVAMSVEALMGSHRPADSRLAGLRPHPGHAQSATNLRALYAGSEINTAHAHCPRVQDAYSCRCAPQVHGATRDALAHVRQVVTAEINAVTDNPIVFVQQVDRDGQNASMDVISGGNFHGQPIALAMDYMGIAVAELANISDRRVEQLVNPATNYGLPAFLGVDPGLDSGFMMAQVAGASLVSENKIQAHPSSVDSIPTSAGREDHVSMGTIGAAKARRIIDNTIIVLAVELLSAARGLDLRLPQKPGEGVLAAHRAIRKVAAPLDSDRSLRPDIQQVTALIREGLVEEVESAVGPLQ